MFKVLIPESLVRRAASAAFLVESTLANSNVGGKISERREWEEHSSVQILCVMNELLPDLLAKNLLVLTAHSSVFREVGHVLEDVC